MIIVSLNINDFGGINEHLANYKRFNYKGDKVTDWGAWKKIEKTTIIDKVKNFII